MASRGLIAVAGVLALLLVVVLGPTKGVLGAVVLMGGAAAAVAVLRSPVLGLHLVLAVGFTAMGLKRLLPQLPMGLAVDGALVLLFVSVVLRPDLAVRLRRLRDTATLPLVAWMGFCVAMVFNPEAKSLVAWMYAVRGIAGYMVLPFLAVLALDDRRQLQGLIVHWGVWAALAAIWGIKQSHVGVMAFEARWLAAGAHVTHILHGKLRAFSFLADTAQFGVTMAFSSMFFGLLATAPLARRWRIAALLLAGLTFYGCMVSGTRSAWAVVPVGLLAYAVLERRWGTSLAAVGGLALVFGMLRYTYVGQGNYHIQRMRQATRPLDDPSFQVRLENQKKLVPYLEDHPFGGGIGSAGYWGQRFSPGTFLANLAMDSHYVRIAAELGPVGFLVFVGSMGGLGLVGFRRYSLVRDPVDRAIYAGHFAVFAGVFVASYSNQYLTQIPTAVIVYQGFALIIGSDRLFRDAGRTPALLEPREPQLARTARLSERAPNQRSLSLRNGSSTTR
jgi:hypothetical protein